MDELLPIERAMAIEDRLMAAAMAQLFAGPRAPMVLIADEEDEA